MDRRRSGLPDIDKLEPLTNVPTLNFHPHLPHYESPAKDGKAIHVLAHQPIDPDRPHPFTAAGSTEFDCLLGYRQSGARWRHRARHSTNFTTLFGGAESLQNFSRNFAMMK